MKLFVLFLLPVWFVSCGIEEHYYLPQSPENNIMRTLDTEARIVIPTVTDSYFFRYYQIFYKIYVTAADNAVIFDNPSTFRGELLSDVSAIRPFTDPANTSASTGIERLFRDRGFHEMRFEGESNSTMMPQGQTLYIHFPTDGISRAIASRSPPTDTNRPNIPLVRSISNPMPDRFFINSEVLRTNTENTDVSRAGGSNNVYVSMYLVTVGFNSAQVRNIYSKPTHIHIFRLHGN